MARILIVDDDPTFRCMVREMLDRAGYEVIEAQDGSVALELFRRQPVDLVITDLVMPVKEGIETILDLRRARPSVKIIAVSGGGRMLPDTSLVLAEKLGANLTLPKPFLNDELLDAVKRVLAEDA